MASYESYGAPNKPDSNCRTCNDFKFWSKQQRQIFHKASDVSALAIGGARIIILNFSFQTKDAAKTGDQAGGGNGSDMMRDDCPLDKSRLGQSTWGLLHTMAAFYTDNPTDNQKKDMKTFFDVFSRLYPCEYCAKDFQKEYV